MHTEANYYLVPGRHSKLYYYLVPGRHSKLDYYLVPFKAKVIALKSEVLQVPK